MLGNIGTLYRTDLQPGTSLWTSTTIDNLTYNYQNPKSSQLQTIQDASNHQAGFKPTTSSYVYDNNGNILFEPQQQLSMTYNHLNLPSFMQWPNGKRLETHYDANGQKWQQVKSDIDQNTQTRTYIAGMEFIGNTLELVAHAEGFIQNIANAPQDRLILSGNATQDESAQDITSFQEVKNNQDITYSATGEVLMQEGFQTESGADFLATISPISSTPNFQWRYTLRDHLGNTRALFTDKNNDGLIRQSSNENLNEVLAFYKYAPFGLELSGSHQNGGQSNNRYRYNGKELESATGFYEYGARWYDPAVGRWLAVDPLAEDYHSYSAYNYVLGNPIMNWDPDGMQVENEYVRFKDSSGDEQYRLVGTEGGNDYDVIYEGEINEDGSLSVDYSDAEVKPVEIENTSGPGNMSLSAQKRNPTPGIREEHNTTPLVFRAIGALFGAQAIGFTNVSATLGFALPKPPRGRGAVPPNKRDPKRVYSKSEKAEMLKNQGGRCAQCNEKKTVDEVHGHHIKRHSDGGATSKDNGAAVCHPCHKKLHKKE